MEKYLPEGVDPKAKQSKKFLKYGLIFFIEVELISFVGKFLNGHELLVSSYCNRFYL